MRAANSGRLPESDVGALEERPDAGGAADVTIGERTARLVNGEITAEIELPVMTGGHNSLLVRFLRTATGEELLAEQREHFWWPGARAYFGNRSGAGEIHQQFRAYPGERLYGMGQRTHGRLDHKGLALDLVQRNAEVSIPFVLSQPRLRLPVEQPRGRPRRVRREPHALDGLAGPRDRLLHHHRHAARRSWPATPTRPATRRGCRSGRAGSGRASCATAARRRSSRSRASTSGAGCRCR